MFCKGCGYDVSGIGADRCPECGRAFDPSNAATFDTVPRRTRRRRTVVRLLLAAAVLAAIIATFPRGYAEGRLTIAQAGGGAIEAVRVQLIPPRWLARHVRYPGWTRRVAAPTPPPVRSVSFMARGWTLTHSGWDSSGTCTAWGDASEMATLVINGTPATLDNADAVFDTILPDIAADRSFGVSIGSTKGSVNPPR